MDKYSEIIEQSYAEIIEQNRKGRKDQDVPNSSTTHARIGITALLKNAEGTAYLFSTELLRDFWFNLKNHIRSFLQNKNNRLEIIVIEEVEENIKLFKEISSEVEPDQVSLVALDEKKLKKSLKSTRSLPNFFVTDDDGYRFEYLDKEMRASTVAAIINFGDENFAKKLKAVFEKLKKSSKESSFFS